MRNNQIKKKRKSTDLSYYPEGSKQKKVSLSQETYAELIQQIEDLEFQLNQLYRNPKISSDIVMTLLSLS